MIDRTLDRVETGWRVLLVDDRPERRSVMRTLVQTASAGSVVVEAASAAAALAAVRVDTIDAAVVEIQMPVPAGIAVITALRAEQPALVIVVCSFHAAPSIRHQALAAGADTYLTKPVSPRDLLLACGPASRASTASSDNIPSGPDSDASSGLHDRSADRQLVAQESPS